MTEPENQVQAIGAPAPRPNQPPGRSSTSRLSLRSLQDFAGDTLFDAVGGVVSEANCLPRKELFESWEVVNRIRRRVRGRPILELAAGHGLEAWMDGALAVDVMRALRLRAAGYRVSLLKIPEEITPQNRLLIGLP